MTGVTGRVNKLLDWDERQRRVLLSPEGVPLDVRVAGHGERLAALILDLAIMMGIVAALYAALIVAVLSDVAAPIGMTVVTFLAFIVRNLYFLHFELAWQGRTPGKKSCGLRVVSRRGGELSPAAVIARNLTREVEIFLPLTLALTLFAEADPAGGLATLGWSLLISSLPLWGRGHLRMGDLIGGTQVIAMPKRALSVDLAAPSQLARPSAEAADAAPAHRFTPAQLSVYGAFELQVLEECLRRPDNPANTRLLAEVCEKIRAKIGWPEPVPAEEVQSFLTDFYAAERASLERGQLFGKLIEDKEQAAQAKEAGRPGR